MTIPKLVSVVHVPTVGPGITIFFSSQVLAELIVYSVTKECEPVPIVPSAFSKLTQYVPVLFART